jgi:hypothetical protein
MIDTVLKSRQQFIRELLTITACIASTCTVSAVLNIVTAQSAHAQGDGGDGGGVDGGVDGGDGGDGGADGVPAGDGGGTDGSPAAPGLDAGTLAVVGMGASAAVVKLKGMFTNKD